MSSKQARILDPGHVAKTTQNRHRYAQQHHAQEANTDKFQRPIANMVQGQASPGTQSRSGPIQCDVQGFTGNQVSG
ncbi:unnamed protein product [Lampetra planeri]